MSAPTLTRPLRGTHVEVLDGIPGWPPSPLTGTVVEPRILELEELLRVDADEREDLVLVEWSTGVRRWEHTDDLRAA